MDDSKMKSNPIVIFLSLLFLLTAAGAIYSVLNFASSSITVGQVIRKKSTVNLPAQHTPVLWRRPISATVNKPTALSSGWLVTDSNGRIICLTEKGDIRWQTSYSNHAWQASSVVDDETICAVTQKGKLFLFELNSGAVKWSKETDITCLHPPLVEMVDQQRVIILLSQEDGTLVCLNARDGTIRWRSPTTSRADGPPTRFGDFIAYGNCDAAVHLFSITNGLLKGSIQLEGDEQVAGGILAFPNEKLLVVGTRSGKLALLNTASMTCLSRASVSDTEAFETPVLVDTKRIFMPASEGRLTYWKIDGDRLVSDDVIRLPVSFNETVVANNIFWAIGNRSVVAVCIKDPSKQLQYTTLGDDLRSIVPGGFGKTVLISDGELICVKGF
jgi:outer membrane protein assembly factor BamB